MYDIFISCKSEDYPDAKQIYEFLSSENYSVFLADSELRKLGSGEFGEAIDAALESAQHLIVFTSNSKYLETGYVKSEWRTFIEEKRSGRKSGNLLTILKNVHTNDLPIALRHFQSFDYKDYQSSILNYVGGKKNIGIPKGEPGILKLRCNVDSLVYVDDEFKDKLEGGKMKKIGLMPGEYLIKVVAAVDESVFEEFTVSMENKDLLKLIELKITAKTGGDSENVESQENLSEFELCLKKAKRGDAKAQSELGEKYFYGNGVTQDYAEAVKWFGKAAEQGDADGQVNLGYMYRNGYGVTQDYAEAVKWFRKAAEQGHAYGQFNLGYMYENGLGVVKNIGEARRWYRKAAEQGSEDAKERLKKL